MAGQGQIDVYTSRVATEPHDRIRVCSPPRPRSLRGHRQPPVPWQSQCWSHPARACGSPRRADSHPLTAQEHTPRHVGELRPVPILAHGIGRCRRGRHSQITGSGRWSSRHVTRCKQLWTAFLCWARVLGVEASMSDDARQTIRELNVVTNTISEVLLIRTEETGPDPQQ